MEDRIQNNDEMLNPPFSQESFINRPTMAPGANFTPIAVDLYNRIDSIGQKISLLSKIEPEYDTSLLRARIAEANSMLSRTEIPVYTIYTVIEFVEVILDSKLSAI